MKQEPELLHPDATQEGADWLRQSAHTPWACGTPPMIGWWDTALVPVGAEPTEEAVFRRWWAGPVSGWSIAVTPSYQGQPLSLIAGMPWRPATTNTLVVWFRGLKEPVQGRKVYAYPLGVQCIDVSHMKVANKALIDFRDHGHADASNRLTDALTRASDAFTSTMPSEMLAAKPSKPRVRVQAEQLSLTLPRTRVQVRNENLRNGRAPARVGCARVRVVV